MTKIDVTMGTYKRPQQFQDSVRSLNELNNAEEIKLFIMDGNDDDAVSEFIESNEWRFKIKIFKESNEIKEKHRGRWPIIYNFLMKQGKSPFITFWSDDIYPNKDCFEIGLKRFKDADVGGVAFAWQDGVDGKYLVYGTELHKQPMINFGLIRRDVMDAIGFIDEQYSFYNADQDLSLKIWYKGFKLLKEAACKVTHYSGQKSDNIYRSTQSYAADSRLFASKWSYENVKKRKVKL